MKTGYELKLNETLKTWDGRVYGEDWGQTYIVSFISADTDTIDFVPGVRFISTHLAKKDGTPSTRRKAFWVTEGGSIRPVDNKAYDR